MVLTNIFFKYIIGLYNIYIIILIWRLNLKYRKTVPKHIRIRGRDMKVKSGLMLREIAKEWVVVPLGARVVELNGIITLSESGAILWRMLEKGADEEELIGALLKEYDIDEETARADVVRFMETIRKNGLCEAESEPAGSHAAAGGQR